MKQFPLLFTFRDVVAGRGFIVGVELAGRAIMVQGEDADDDQEPQWWVYGVEPGGLAESGDGDVAAYYEFREGYRLVLHDIAERSADFADFSSNVQRFFEECDVVEEARWLEAVEALREQRVKATGALADLPRESAKSPRCVQIVELKPEQMTPDSNRVDHEYSIPTAA